MLMATLLSALLPPSMQTCGAIATLCSSASHVRNEMLAALDDDAHLAVARAKTALESKSESARQGTIDEAMGSAASAVAALRTAFEEEAQQEQVGRAVECTSSSCLFLLFSEYMLRTTVVLVHHAPSPAHTPRLVGGSSRHARRG